MTYFRKGDLVRIAKSAKSIFGDTKYSGDLGIIFHEQVEWAGRAVVFVLGYDPNDPADLDKAYDPKDVSLVRREFFTRVETEQFWSKDRPTNLVTRFVAEQQADKERNSTIRVADLRRGDVVKSGGVTLEVDRVSRSSKAPGRVLVTFRGLPAASYSQDALFWRVRAKDADKELPVGTLVRFHRYDSYYKKVAADRWVDSDQYGSRKVKSFTDSDVGGRIRRNEPHTIIH